MGEEKKKPDGKIEEKVEVKTSGTMTRLTPTSMSGTASGTSFAVIHAPAPSDTPLSILEPKREDQALALTKRREALKFVLTMHRGKDGYAIFSHTNPETGEWVDDCSVQVSHLENVFPELLFDLLQPDGRVSVHTMYRAAPFPSRIELPDKLAKAMPPKYRKGHKGSWKYDGHLAGSFRSVDAIRHLEVCFADIDIHKLGIPPGVALGAIKHLQDTGELPKASMITFAGEGGGVWVFWLLADSANPYSPPTFFGPKKWWTKNVYLQVQRELHRRLAFLGADGAAATNLTVSTRYPGSIHTKTGKGTECWFPTTDGKGHVYTLEDMQRFFGITMRELSPVERKAVSGEVRDRKGWGGFNRVHASYLRQFLSLWSIRGRFHEGTRNRAALLYAFLLHRNGESKEELKQRVLTFGREGCKPRLSDNECLRAIRSALRIKYDPKQKKGGVIRKDTIAEWLDISPTEVGYLDTWPVAARYLAPEEKPRVHPARKEAEEVREQIGKILEEAKRESWGRVTCREMADILRQREIADLNFATVSRHMARVKHGTKSLRAYRKKRQRHLNFESRSTK